MINTLKNQFEHLFNLSSRENRPAFWWFTLDILLYGIVYHFLDGDYYPNNGFFNAIKPETHLLNLMMYFFGCILVYAFAVAIVRRLHDTNLSGGWFWLGLIPFFGAIALIVLCFRPTKNVNNRFGKVAPIKWWTKLSYWIYLILIMLGIAVGISAVESFYNIGYEACYSIKHAHYSGNDNNVHISICNMSWK